MITIHDQRDVIYRLVQWARLSDSIRAMLLTSSRANPAGRVDIFSDFDVVLVVEDIHLFFTDRSWLQDFGAILVAYWDPIEPYPALGLEQTGNVIQYMDGLHIDFRLWPVALVQRIVQAPLLPSELDIGYTVLLDKDHLAIGLQPPAFRAYIPLRPPEHAYQTWIRAPT